jgi:hypothetical protein
MIAACHRINLEVEFLFLLQQQQQQLILKFLQKLLQLLPAL